MKKRRKLKLFNLISLVLCVIFLILFIYSSYRVILWHKNNKDNKKINVTLHKYIETGNNEKYKINFDKLKTLNSDTAAYIKVENTNIDYVAVKGKDNSYYLDHNFNKKYNRSGWIFIDYKNKLDGTDRNIVIYGHNTVDKSMFGSLHKVLSDEWFEKNKDSIIIFITPEGINKYQIFSTYKIDSEDYYITTDFKKDDEYLKFLDTIKSRSKFNYNVNVTENDTILTLSTCANSGSKRVVLHAKKIS